MKMYLPGLVTDLFGSTIDHPHLTGSLILEFDCLPCLRVLEEKKRDLWLKGLSGFYYNVLPFHFPLPSAPSQNVNLIVILSLWWQYDKTDKFDFILHRAKHMLLGGFDREKDIKQMAFMNIQFLLYTVATSKLRRRGGWDRGFPIEINGYAKPGQRRIPRFMWKTSMWIRIISFSRWMIH